MFSLTGNRARLGRLTTLATLAASVVACDNAPFYQDPGDAKGFSRAWAAWTPGSTDTCSREIHQRYSVVGPDGLLYPTWHPPIDSETGCQFGHEHGRDPRGSDLYKEVGPIPFGYANQQQDVYDPYTSRHEDHVGHKVEWENDVKLDFNGAASAVLEVTCDVLAKLHQGTHSKDAFTNNLHELVYHIRCTDGTAMSVTVLTPIGTAGEFVSSCTGAHIKAGTPSPANSPDGGGQRRIPDRACIDSHILRAGTENSNFGAGLHESWETSNSVRTAEGRTVASFDPYFQVQFASRFYDPSMPDNTGRPILLCYGVNGLKAQGSMCRDATANGQIQGVAYDDPRSPFNGVLRFIDVNSNRINNADGAEFWYSDPMGKHAQKTPFPGSIRQYIAAIDNGGRVGGGPVLGRDRNYGGAGVHAPN